MAAFSGFGFCCCDDPLAECDYSDDFAFLRDWESDTHLDALGDDRAPIGEPPAFEYDGFQTPDVDPESYPGRPGWYTSSYRSTLSGLCTEFEGGGECATVNRDQWAIQSVNYGDRLYCRNLVRLLGSRVEDCGDCPGTPAGTCGGRWALNSQTGYGGDLTVRPGDDWRDTGTLLKRFVPLDTQTPDVTASVLLYGDPMYGQNMPAPSEGESACAPVNPGGRYGQWGLHIGELPEAGSMGIAAPSVEPTNRVWLYLDAEANGLGVGTATGKLVIWDKDGHHSTTTLGTAHDALPNSGIAAEIRFYRDTASQLRSIDVTIGGQTTTVSDIDFSGDLMDSGGLTPSLPIGLFAIAGGEFSGFCVNGVDVSDNCSLCETDGLGESWSIETGPMGTGWDTEDVGDCGSPTSCQESDPWSGTQILGPWDDGINACAWRSCHNAPGCYTDSGTVWCDTGTDRAITMVTDTANNKLVLNYWYYNGGPVWSQQLLARYEAPISEVCGPATFTKVFDGTSGGYFPATVTATRVHTPQGCGGDDEPPGAESTCCPDAEMPETLTATQSGESCISISSLVSGGTGTWSGTLTFTPGPFCNVNCSAFEVPITLRCLYESVEGAGAGVVGWALSVDGTEYLATTFECDPFEAEFTGIDLSAQCGLALVITITVTE